MDAKREYTGPNVIKVLLIGDHCCGKSSLNRALHGQKFLESLDNTLGIGFTTAQTCWHGKDVTLSTWEVSIENIGLLACLNVSFDYILMCFVADSRRTLSALGQSKEILQRNLNTAAQFLLVGCQSDQLELLAKPELSSYVSACTKAAMSINTPVVFASAADGFNVAELKASLIESHLRDRPVAKVLKKRAAKLTA